MNRYLLAVLLLAVGRAHGQAPAHASDASLVPRFLGCYALDLGERGSYKLRLTDTPMGQSWVAVDVETGNRPGNEWHWAPLDSTRFDLEWGGIDAAMSFTVTRHAASYGATGKGEWSSGPKPGSAELHPTVRPIECPGAK